VLELDFRAVKFLLFNFQTYIIFSINLVSLVILRSSGTDILYGCHLLLDVCDFYKIYIHVYILQWLAISDKQPRFILVKNVFRIVHSRMCKNTRFGLFYIFRPMKKLTQFYIRTWNWWYGIIWCKQCSFLVNFLVKYKDINKSNKRQTYTDYMGVLGEKCSPKWASLDSFPVCCQLFLCISNVAIISKAISLSNIFRNADF
jgi:hypothetical protein